MGLVLQLVLEADLHTRLPPCSGLDHGCRHPRNQMRVCRVVFPFARRLLFLYMRCYRIDKLEPWIRSAGIGSQRLIQFLVVSIQTCTK